ncbi:hypothetical protein ACQKFG_27440 [Peribacillus sp. NPDC076916]|uniref:hypothetical protein n=1 Tax=Peribacillus sp. NPDC076916 TaxID=3390608 RepID=UPI003D05E6FE
MIPKELMAYIIIGGGVGLFFGGFWNGISAMVLIWIAIRFEYFIRTYEKKNLESGVASGKCGFTTLSKFSNRLPRF